MSTPPKDPNRKRITLTKLAEMRALGEPIVMITAYDHPSALVVEEAGVDVVLVGDSAANNVLGYTDTVPVTVEELLMLTRAVRRGLTTPLLVGDLPFGSYEASDAQAIETAHRFVKEAGCDAVKLEGGGASRRARPRDRARRRPGHGPRRPDAADGDDARRLPRPGPHRRRAPGRCSTTRSRCRRRAASRSSSRPSPADVTDAIMPYMEIPIIGIGAGPSTDGQVLVLHDLLTIHDDFQPKFAKRFAAVKDEMRRGVDAYAEEVRTRAFPAPEHTYGIAPEELERFRAELAGRAANDSRNKPFTRVHIHWPRDEPARRSLFASKEREFFDLFEEAARNFVRAAELLEHDARAVARPRRARMRDVVVCEQEGDRITHDIIQRLNHDVRDAVRPRGHHRARVGAG